MGHHNRDECDAWPCNPGPAAGHHPPHRSPDDEDEDDRTTSEARVHVEKPRHPEGRTDG